MTNDPIRVILKQSTAMLALAVAAGMLGSAKAGHAQTATFAGIDTTTQGSWAGHYGADGYTVVGGTVDTPSYSKAISAPNAAVTTWKTVTAADLANLRDVAVSAARQGDVPNAGNNAVAADFNVRYALTALDKSEGGSDRIAAAWHNTANTPGTSFTIDVPITDTKKHQVALYCLDQDNGSRFETIQVKSSSTGAVLDTHSISYFTFGQYLIWNVTGHVQFVVTQTSGANAVVSGIFLDPPAAPTPVVTLGAISVTQYGAVGSGSVDNTAAFQKALDAAGRTGAIVKVPAGRYYFGSASNPNPALDVPAQVVLEGVNAGERSCLGGSRGTASSDVTEKGTVFLVGAGADGTVPFLTLNANSALRNATIYYPHQPLSATNGWSAPTPYPATIYMDGNNASVDNVCGVNPYLFITKSLDGSSVRTNVRHVSGQPLSRGLVVDADPDVTHYEDIHFGHTWDKSPAMARWMLANAWGFAIYRGDDLKFTDCSAVGYNRGFYFGFSHLPSTVDLVRGRSGPYSGGLQACTAENCAYGVWIDASRQDTDITFHGCAFSSNLTTHGTAVMISNNVDTNGNMTFEGCRFWQAKGPLFINQARAGGNITIAGCSFDAWGTQSTGLDPASAAITCGDVSSPNAPSAKTLIVNCIFNLDKYTYTATPSVQGVLFEGNTTVNGPHIQSASTLRLRLSNKRFLAQNTSVSCWAGSN